MNMSTKHKLKLKRSTTLQGHRRKRVRSGSSSRRGPGRKVCSMALRWHPGRVPKLAAAPVRFSGYSDLPPIHKRTLAWKLKRWLDRQWKRVLELARKVARWKEDKFMSIFEKGPKAPRPPAPRPMPPPKPNTTNKRR